MGSEEEIHFRDWGLTGKENNVGMGTLFQLLFSGYSNYVNTLKL